MADADSARLDGGSGAAPCGRAVLAQATSLGCGRHVHTAWPEPSPDAPRRGINHLKGAFERAERRVVQRDAVAPEGSTRCEQSLAERPGELVERAPARLRDLLR